MTRKIAMKLDGVDYLTIVTIDAAQVHMTVNELLPNNNHRLVGQGNLRVGQVGKGRGRIMMDAVAKAFATIIDEQGGAA